MRIVVRTLIVLSLAVATSLHAITYIVPNDRDLVKRAEAIVIATAVESHAELRDGQRIVTVAALQVERVLKGSVGQTVQLVELGGAIGGRVKLIPGSPRYENGKRYLVFLRTNSLGEWMTYGFALGKFEFISDLKDRELVTRGGSDEQIFGLDEADGSLHVEHLRGAPAFLSFVQSRVASDSPASEDYFVSQTDVIFASFPEFQPHTNTLIPRIETTRPDYMLDCGGAPCRWPSPTASFVHCCSAQTGGTGLNGPSGAASAMAAWNAAGAGVGYSLTGQDLGATAGLSGPDSRNGILFNDPQNMIPAGAVAVGGITDTFPGPTPLGDGFSYFSTKEVDVVTGKNLPSFVGQSLYIQLLTHELGHTLGYRHADGTSSPVSPPPSCQSPSPCASIGQAIMASVLPSGNNIGSLGQWDMDAVNTVYGHGPVCNAPSITTQPASQSISSGSAANLSVGASGTATLTYQWFIGNSPPAGSAVGGATSATFHPTPATTTSYWVQVSNTCNGTQTANSNTAVVTVTCTPPSAPTPIAAPTSIPNGQSSTISVNATGSGPLTYQWFVGNSGDTSSPIGSATNSFVTVSPTVTTSYWVRVTGQCAPVADSRNVTVTVTCSPIASQGVIAQPSTINSGQSSTLFFSTTGSGPFAIQWYTGGQGDTSNPIPGATSTSTVVSPVVTTGYWVRVSAPCGSQDGSTVVIVNGTVCTAPSITTQPASSSISAGSPVTLTVSASGTAPFTYQWYIGDKGDVSHPILGATLASLTQSPAATTKYWVRVSNSCSGTQSADSNAATITVTAATCTNPSITAQPADVSVGIGSTATLKVVAAGTSTLHYQWFQGVKGDTSKPTGTDSATLVTAVIKSTTSYWVHVTNQCAGGAPADSNAAMVTAVVTRGRAVRH
ncbi:MAG TPA: hypothetical protein VGA84_12645 [Thermoanaerobaculia bacterium]